MDALQLRWKRTFLDRNYGNNINFPSGVLGLGLLVDVPMQKNTAVLSNTALGEEEWGGDNDTNDGHLSRGNRTSNRLCGKNFLIPCHTQDHFCRHTYDKMQCQEIIFAR